MKGANETQDNIDNATEYRDTLNERIENGPNTTIRDQLVTNSGNTGPENGDIELEAMGESKVQEVQQRGQDITEDANKRISNMKQSSDFGSEKMSLEDKNAILTSDNDDAEAILNNVNEYIKTQQSKQAQPNALAQIYQGIGTIVAGGATIGSGVFTQQAASHTAESKIYDAAQNAASSMLNNAQQQWNSIVSSLNQLYSLIMQISAANKVQ